MAKNKKISYLLMIVVLIAILVIVGSFFIYESKMVSGSIFSFLSSKTETNSNSQHISMVFPHIFYTIVKSPGTPMEEERIYHKYLTSNGWQIEQIFPGSGFILESIANENNTPHIGAVRDNEIYYITNKEGKWVSEIVLSNLSRPFVSDIVINSKNMVYIIYTNCTGFLPDRDCDLRYVYKDPQRGWIDSPIQIEGDVGFFASAEFDSKDNLRVSYWQSYYLPTAGGIWWYSYQKNNSWVKEIVWKDYLPNKMEGWYSSLAVDNYGFVHMSHFILNPADGRYNLGYVTNNVTLSNGNTTWYKEIVDNFPGSAIGGSVISINEANQPTILYGYNPTKYATRLDTNHWNIESASLGGCRGGEVSLAFDSNKNPYAVCVNMNDPYIIDDDFVTYFFRQPGGGWVETKIISEIASKGNPLIYIENR